MNSNRGSFRASGRTFAPPHSPPQTSLPHGWVARIDQRYQRYFYVNLATKRSQWEMPLEAIIAPIRGRASGEYSRPVTYPNGIGTPGCGAGGAACGCKQRPMTTDETSTGARADTTGAAGATGRASDGQTMLSAASDHDITAATGRSSERATQTTTINPRTINTAASNTRTHGLITVGDRTSPPHPRSAARVSSREEFSMTVREAEAGDASRANEVPGTNEESGANEQSGADEASREDYDPYRPGYYQQHSHHCSRESNTRVQGVRASTQAPAATATSIRAQSQGGQGNIGTSAAVGTPVRSQYQGGRTGTRHTAGAETLVRSQSYGGQISGRTLVAIDALMRSRSQTVAKSRPREVSGTRGESTDQFDTVPEPGTIDVNTEMINRGAEMMRAGAEMIREGSKDLSRRGSNARVGAVWEGREGRSHRDSKYEHDGIEALQGDADILRGEAGPVHDEGTAIAGSGKGGIVHRGAEFLHYGVEALRGGAELVPAGADIVGGAARLVCEGAKAITGYSGQDSGSVQGERSGQVSGSIHEGCSGRGSGSGHDEGCCVPGSNLVPGGAEILLDDGADLGAGLLRESVNLAHIDAEVRTGSTDLIDGGAGIVHTTTGLVVSSGGEGLVDGLKRVVRSTLDPHRREGSHDRRDDSCGRDDSRGGR